MAGHTMIVLFDIPVVLFYLLIYTILILFLEYYTTILMNLGKTVSNMAT
jgi:hypothetical protein